MMINDGIITINHYHKSLDKSLKLLEYSSKIKVIIMIWYCIIIVYWMFNGKSIVLLYYHLFIGLSWFIQQSLTIPNHGIMMINDGIITINHYHKSLDKSLKLLEYSSKIKVIIMIWYWIIIVYWMFNGKSIVLLYYHLFIGLSWFIQQSLTIPNHGIMVINHGIMVYWII